MPLTWRVSHHTVARVVAERSWGCPAPDVPAEVIDEFLPKVEEGVEASKGKVRADVAHEKLMAMSCRGRSSMPSRPCRDKSDTSSERAGAPALGSRTGPVAPGSDFGDGPVIDRDRRRCSSCAWLASLSRFRIAHLPE